MYKIFFSQKAEQELEDAISYYQEHTEIKALEFWDEINHFLERIALNPYSFPVVKLPYRKSTLIQFPYLIIFEIKDRYIEIIAIRHQKQNNVYFE